MVWLCHQAILEWIMCVSVRLALLILVLTWLPVAAQQPTKLPHIGFLRAETPDPLLDEFRNGLRELGYVDG